MQTILGGGGPIGLELARILPDYTERVRIVGRNPEKVIPENEVFVANLLDSEAVRDAVAGSDVAYLSVGLPPSTRSPGFQTGPRPAARFLA